MPKSEDILWFKKRFGPRIEAAVAGTPFCTDMVTAVACQETGDVWKVLSTKPLSENQILELCVGDTIDASKGRKAFPRDKEDLLAKPGGSEMFGIARQALVDMAAYIDGYKSVASNPDKFCHAFGIFQYDLQFFLTDPSYFLSKCYADFDQCLKKCIGELCCAMQRMGWQHKTALSDLEKAYVAIAYNTGGFKPQKGLKQGYYDGNRYYGEYFYDYLRLSQTVLPAASAAPQPVPGNALIAPPTPVKGGAGARYEVEVRSDPLRLRSEPVIDESGANVVAHLPDGQVVQAVSDEQTNGFLKVETNLGGAHYCGYAAAKYLKKLSGAAPEIPTPIPVPTLPDSGVVAIDLPHQPGAITMRRNPADAYSLNEPGQPIRNGTTPAELCTELAAIIDWLAVDDPLNKRYQPYNNSTFCNIYAHDYCSLAGVYLPRIWWTPGAIERLAQGKTVAPLLGNTVEEQRANDLFRWLRDFGLRFGWRRTGTLTKLQTEVNQGAVGIIVACRKEDGRPGHIVAVVPETEDKRAKRDASGEVTTPLQSQAGSRNFRYGTGTPNWWKGEQFADSAFWIHP